MEPKNIRRTSLCASTLGCYVTGIGTEEYTLEGHVDLFEGAALAVSATFMLIADNFIVKKTLQMEGRYSFLRSCIDAIPLAAYIGGIATKPLLKILGLQ